MAIKRISIHTRILVTILTLIGVVFLAISLVFNVLVEDHIESSIYQQLQDIQIAFQEHHPEVLLPGGPPPRDRGGRFMKMMPDNRWGRPESLIVSEDYQVLFPDASMNFIQNYDQIQSLALQIKEQGIELDSSEISRLKAGGREYYFVSLPLSGTPFNNSAYLIYYIDKTAIISFLQRINMVLLVVMGITGLAAAAIAIFLSGKIAQPIKELTSFAAQIGRGDFRKNECTYQDIELAELAASMNKAAAQLAAYDKEQKPFFQNVSHELRTPLQVIKCNAEGIAHGILEPAKASGVIISETDRLTEMVQDLLYISRLDKQAI